MANLRRKRYLPYRLTCRICGGCSSPAGGGALPPPASSAAPPGTRRPWSPVPPAPGGLAITGGRRPPAAVIVSAAPGYRLALSADSVDAWWFDDQVRAAQSEDDPRRRADLLTAALTQWAGEPYAEVSDAAWAIAEIARLTELRL